MARAVMQQFTVGPASPHQTPVTPSSTVGHHTTNGTDISILATAHGLEEGMIVTLAGWAWATGSGVIDGTYIVKTRTDANNFTLTPTTCPTGASNPETVGTYSFARADDRVLKIAVDATYGTKVSLPCGWWSVKHTAKTTAAAASTGLLAYRFTDSLSDVTLPEQHYGLAPAPRGASASARWLSRSASWPLRPSARSGTGAQRRCACRLDLLRRSACGVPESRPTPSSLLR